MNRIRHFLSLLLPQNSLFGRIFIWFWTAIILMIVLAFYAARYFGQTWEVNALSEGQLDQPQRLIKVVQEQVNRRNSLERALRRVGNRANRHLLAINQSTDEIVYGFPPPLIRGMQGFKELKSAETPFFIRSSTMDFIGPFLIQVNDQPHQIYVGKLLRRDQRPVFVLGIALTIVILVGTLACLVISWTLAKPLKHLSSLSKALAANENVANDTQLMHRKDEIGQLHNDVFDMANKLAASLVKQKALMANISHELRTPLTRLQLATAMLNPNTEQQKDYTLRIEKDIQIMDSLIGQALQLAKLDESQREAFVSRKLVRFADFFSPLADNLKFEAKAKQVTLTISELPQVNLYVVEPAFNSAIENVIRNAIKYCKQRVDVTFNIQTANGAARVLNIFVEDDGEGLSEKQMSQIFSPFYRAEQSKKEKGTGLGLTIAKSAIELHKGDILASSSPLGGLCINLIIPIEID